jgi:hypothetical protein
MKKRVYDNIDVKRLYELQQKIDSDSATRQEKNELMRMLYENESLSTELYTNYINGKRTESLLKTGNTLACLILFSYELSKYDFSSLRVR